MLAFAAGDVETQMSHQQLHWFEKQVVQLTAAAALAVVYFLLYPAVRLCDERTAIAFFPTGSYGQALAFAVMVVALAGACGLMTISARPEGAILATLVAVGGISLHSASFNTLLWMDSDGYGGTLRLLAAETLFMGVILTVAVAVIGGVRRMVRAVRPNWLWRSPMGEPAAPRRQNFQLLLGRSLVSMGLSVLIAVVLLLILLQSDQRGQAIFALVASFTLAVLIAHRSMPAPFSVVFLAGPLLAGIFLYILASVASIGTRVEDWVMVPLYARALPIDWLSAGGAGAALGFWLSERGNEAQFLENLDVAKGS
ncbi:MAG: hypothetical protein WC869_04255 [Phycisphaerae bacterium]|jgi:hypothetical protein